MTEDDLLFGLVGDRTRPGALIRGGYFVHHIRRSDLAQQQGAGGWPDLVCVNPKTGRLIVLELKAEKGRVDPLQRMWLDAFEAAGVDARIVRPADYDRLVEELVGDRLVKRVRR